MAVLTPKSSIIRYILKNNQKNTHVCVHEIIKSIIMKMKIKMKNTSHRYNINRLRSRHGHKCSKYKICFSVMMLLCIKQHLTNIWSPIPEKVKQHWGCAKKKALLIKKIVYFIDIYRPLNVCLLIQHIWPCYIVGHAMICLVFTYWNCEMKTFTNLLKLFKSCLKTGQFPSELRKASTGFK